MSASVNSFRRRALSELAAYAGFREHWDGYRASRFEADVLRRAAQAVDQTCDLLIAKSISPTDMQTGPASDGSVDVDTEYGGRRLLLTFYPGVETANVSREQSGRYHQEESIVDASNLARLVDWLADPSAVPLASRRD
jgi:hypothetical protein